MKYRLEQCPDCKFIFRIVLDYINQAYCEVDDNKLESDTIEPCPYFIKKKSEK